MTSMIGDAARELPAEGPVLNLTREDGSTVALMACRVESVDDAGACRVVRMVSGAEHRVRESVGQIVALRGGVRDIPGVIER